MCYPPNLSLILGCALCILCSSILHDFKVSNTQAWELSTGQTPLPWCFCLSSADLGCFVFSEIPTLVVAGCWAISNVAKYTVFLADDTSRGDTGPGQLFVAWKLSWMWDWVSWCCWDVEWMDRDVGVPCSGFGWFFKHHSSSWLMSILGCDQSVCLFQVRTSRDSRACSINSACMESGARARFIDWINAWMWSLVTKSMSEWVN